MVAGRPSSGSSSAPDLPLGFFAASQPHCAISLRGGLSKGNCDRPVFGRYHDGNKKSGAAGPAAPPERHTWTNKYKKYWIRLFNCISCIDKSLCRHGESSQPR